MYVIDYIYARESELERLLKAEPEMDRLKALELTAGQVDVLLEEGLVRGAELFEMPIE